MNATLKPLDAWWTVLVVDPVVVRLVRPFARARRISPTHLTITAHLLGVASAAAFLTGRYLLAAILFEVRFVFDCIDGKVARLRGTPSEVGATLDFVGDYIVAAANMVALGVGLAQAGEQPIWLSAALPAVYLTYIAGSQAWIAEVSEGPPTGLITAERVPGGYRAWMARRRLRSLPGRIDFEHGLLFCSPLVAWTANTATPVVVASAIAAAYFTYGTLHFLEMSLRLASRKDAAASSDGE